MHHRPVIEITSPPEAPLPGSSMIEAVLFPAFAVIGLVLGFVYSMPWLITSSLAISLALLAVVGGTFLNRCGRAGKLRLDLSDGATRITPAPAARLFPLIAGGLALLVILVDIALRLMGYFADEDGLTFSLLVALVIVWGAHRCLVRLEEPARPEADAQATGLDRQHGQGDRGPLVAGVGRADDRAGPHHDPDRQGRDPGGCKPDGFGPAARRGAGGLLSWAPGAAVRVGRRPRRRAGEVVEGALTTVGIRRWAPPRSCWLKTLEP